jgi:hypothetical protein
MQMAYAGSPLLQQQHRQQQQQRQNKAKSLCYL